MRALRRIQLEKASAVTESHWLCLHVDGGGEAQLFDVGDSGLLLVAKLRNLADRLERRCTTS